MGLKDDKSAIQQMKANGLFNNYIEYIRYPKFRNLEPNTKIEFNFPLTFLVGKNGGGKSSTLQSLYGCPINGAIKEVLKQRAPQKGNLDYWEPSKPIKKYERNYFEVSSKDKLLLIRELKDFLYLIDL